MGQLQCCCFCICFCCGCEIIYPNIVIILLFRWLQLWYKNTPFLMFWLIWSGIWYHKLKMRRLRFKIWQEANFVVLRIGFIERILPADFILNSGFCKFMKFFTFAVWQSHLSIKESMFCRSTGSPVVHLMLHLTKRVFLLTPTYVC